MLLTLTMLLTFSDALKTLRIPHRANSPFSWPSSGQISHFLLFKRYFFMFKDKNTSMKKINTQSDKWVKI